MAFKPFADEGLGYGTGKGRYASDMARNRPSYVESDLSGDAGVAENIYQQQQARAAEKRWGTGPSPMQKLFAAINQDGVQHSNKFEVRVWPPGFAPGVEEIDLRCESVTMPGRTLNSITDSNIFGPTRELVDGVTYAEDVTCSFVADAKFGIRRFFESWQELAFDPNTWEVKYANGPDGKGGYLGHVEIFTLSQSGDRMYGVTLKEAFPKTLSANELNMTSINELQRISVGFSFRYWLTYPAGGVDLDNDAQF